jgi:replicative DNA helicase
VLSGVASGFYDFDAMTSGIHKSTLTLLGARPAMGKTAFVSNLASRMCLEEKQPVSIFTFDTSASQFMMRLLTLGAKVDANRLRTGHLHEKDWARLRLAADQLKEAPLVLDDSCYTFDALANRCRELKKTPDGLFLVIIDEFQQLLTGEFDIAGNENKPEAYAALEGAGERTGGSNLCYFSTFAGAGVSQEQAPDTQ